MTLTYSGVHAHTEDADAIVTVLSDTLAPGGYRLRDAEVIPIGAAVNQFLISPPLGGWTTVLPSNDLDGREYAWAETVSSSGVSALWLYLYESDFLMYRLYRGGQLVDRYHSASIDNVGVGNPRVFRSFLVPGATIEDLDRVLRPDPGDALPVEDRYFAIARLLGIQCAETSYEVALADPLTLTGGQAAWRRVQFWYAGAPPEIATAP